MNGKRISDVAGTLAGLFGEPEETIIIRGRIARSHVRRRYTNIRNAAIRAAAKRGTPLAAIAARYGLSKGRISQIINHQNEQGATIQ